MNEFSVFVFTVVLFVLFYLWGRSSGRRLGIWEGERRAAKRQREAYEAMRAESRGLTAEESAQMKETYRRFFKPRPSTDSAVSSSGSPTNEGEG